MVSTSAPINRIIVLEAGIPAAVTTTPRSSTITKDCLVTRQAYSRSPAPEALATRAVVPTTNALNTENINMVG